ncbi:MAG TPA: hypothetical protein VFU69_03150, partial [Ktedonobacterales bacterium]|nr:hypothetical protein [Ktedonobacterales bacterium]
DPASTQEHYQRLEARAIDALARHGIPPERQRLLRSADMRYQGQAYEVRVDIPAGAIDAATGQQAVEAFHLAHRRAYGYDYRGKQQVEFVNLRVTGLGLIDKPALHEIETGGPDAAAARKGERAVYFEAVSDFQPCPLYDRTKLLSGNRITGPAIIEEYGSTTVVFPGQQAIVDRFGSLLLTRGPIDPGSYRKATDVSAPESYLAPAVVLALSYPFHLCRCRSLPGIKHETIRTF